MGKALFGIDSTIARDPLTNPIVTRFATDQDYFFKVFSSAFVKLSSTKVLTAKEGEMSTRHAVALAFVSRSDIVSR
ncbi:hypothetical protein G4B88_010651 [Cannabis sativa]|uniref:Plant heme peroxidase family profile domain-containing protein n=1 Tax=Cannabis sativa TaxID=3483 RepID=A0A7J6G8Q9_CANSA|nr:hypothetical protein G4B88_010651 [Cannabis sativa]